MEYVQKKNGDYWLRGTRISLDSVVFAFLNGQTPESIAQSFPTVTLEQVYGAITYYLANRSEIDDYLDRCKTAFDAKRQSSQEKDPMFYQKLADARRHFKVTQP